MKKLLVALAITAFSVPVFADSIRTADGISCSFDADDSPYEVEAYIENGDESYDSRYLDGYNASDRDDNKIGLKLTYKFGGPKRLNCDTLYQMELRSKEAKLRELEAKLAAIEAAQSINWE
ncbi:hypothetical protein VPHD479_0230 [Vibrio phage D479]